MNRMSIDVDVLVESYAILKQYIPVKERQEAADNLACMLSDSISEDELREFATADVHAKRAVEEYLIHEDADDNYNDYED